MDKAPDAFRTISEVADELDLPQHVLRFWESRFPQIKPMKRAGGRRYYRPDDVDLLRGIRHLLYGEGYTIRGVQRILKDQGGKFVQTVWQAGAAQPARMPEDAEPDDGDIAGEEERGGLLSFLVGRGAPPEAEHAAQQEAQASRDTAPAAAEARLPPASRRALEAALAELVECRRLLDAALGSPAAPA